MINNIDRDVTKSISLVLVLLIAFWRPIAVSGHPSASPNEHPHTEENILWSFGAEDGESAHKHSNGLSFGSHNTFSRTPYTSYGCWDNREWRLDMSGLMNKAHCYVKESNSSYVVRYAFIPATPPMPAEAKSRGRDAFSEYSSIKASDHPNLISATGSLMKGIEFVEVSSSAEHDVAVEWVFLGPENNGGRASNTDNPVRLVQFDSSVNSDFYLPEEPFWHFVRPKALLLCGFT